MKTYAWASLATLMLFYPIAATAQDDPPTTTQRITLSPGFATSLVTERSYRDVIVGDDEIISVEPGGTDRRLIVKGLKSGITNMLVRDGDGAVIANLTVAVGGGGEVLIHSKIGNVHGYTAYRCTPVCHRVADELEGQDRIPPANTTINIGPKP